MLLFKKVSYIAVSALLLTATGCSKFDDININPNEAAQPVTSALLTNVETTLPGLGMPSNLSYYVQYYSQIQYPAEQLYTLTNIGWDATYNNPLKDLQSIIELNTAKPDQWASTGNTINQTQIARILRAYIYMTLTDRYGDIPYSQAVKGESKVAYDKQQDIYTDLFKELREAIAAFQSTGEPIKGDIIYGGNLAKWKRFANSLRMVMAMNLSEVAPTTSRTEFLAALNDPNGFITENTDNFALKYPGGSFNHPYYNLTGASALALSGTVSDKLNPINDPRVKAFGQASGGAVKGIPYGLDRANNLNWTDDNPDYSLLYATEHKQRTSTATILPASYVYLLRAEAALNYGTGENAYDLLKSAVEKSFAQWNVTGN
ncbi:MAG TPA: SusD/RagB family nutrient-binding outer membrane lipoprotein, partial [Flavisolibacter sp.]|nr:SusD/RagB family nutrient-binding outer membrane lipoprotein [Flavisolibacter sp.]